MRGKISPAIKQKFTTNDSFAKLFDEPEFYQKGSGLYGRRAVYGTAQRQGITQSTALS